MPLKKNKWIKKTTTIAILFALGTTLAACSSHKNALAVKPKNVSTNFLISASRKAEAKLGINIRFHGRYYAQCMDGDAVKAKCQQLYKLMLNYAKSTSNFNNLTLDDLTNVQVYQSLRSDIENKVTDII